MVKDFISDWFFIYHLSNFEGLQLTQDVSYSQTVFCFVFFGICIFISDQTFSAVGNRNKTYICFVPLEMSRVARWIISFVLKIFVIASPTS